MPISEEMSHLLTRGAVVIVPFPYADRLAEKRRPAVVVSGGEMRDGGLAWLAMVTSARNAGWSCDVPIADLETAGLPAPSVVRPWKLATVDVARIAGIVGKLPGRELGAVMERIEAVLDLSSRPTR
jgi:mRNA interferase MazF